MEPTSEFVVAESCKIVQVMHLGPHVFRLFCGTCVSVIESSTTVPYCDGHNTYHWVLRYFTLYKPPRQSKDSHG